MPSNQSNKKRIRIKDIAALAGVSAGTVDRVIHGRGNVSKKAEERVRKVLKELNYETNIIASTLARKFNYRVATLLPDYHSDPYWEQPQRGVEKAFASVRHFNVHWEPRYFNLFDTAGFRRQAEAILASQPHALLFAPIFLQESRWLIDECRQAGIPTVKINTDIEEDHSLCYVGQDSYQSGILAARLLNFGLDKTQAAMIINLDRETTNAQHLIDKEKGFRDYFSSVYRHELRVIKCDFPDFDNRPMLRAFLIAKFAEFPELKGIFVTNSRAYKMLDSMGEQWPSDIKIVGFDLLPPNLHYLRKNKISFLINQNPEQQGYQGLINIYNYLVLKKNVEPLQYLPLDIVVTENVQYYINQELEAREKIAG
jgi:LacI family transcriptional regulator